MWVLWAALALQLPGSGELHADDTHLGVSGELRSEVDRLKRNIGLFIAHFEGRPASATVEVTPASSLVQLQDKEVKANASSANASLVQVQDTAKANASSAASSSPGSRGWTKKKTGQFKVTGTDGGAARCLHYDYGGGGAALQVKACVDGETSQKFNWYTSPSGKWGEVTSSWTENKCLDVGPQGSGDWQLKMVNCNEADRQRWDFVDSGLKTSESKTRYYVHNQGQGTGRCMDMPWIGSVAYMHTCGTNHWAHLFEFVEDIKQKNQDGIDRTDKEYNAVKARKAQRQRDAEAYWLSQSRSIHELADQQIHSATVTEGKADRDWAQHVVVSNQKHDGITEQLGTIGTTTGDDAKVAETKVEAAVKTFEEEFKTMHARVQVTSSDSALKLNTGALAEKKDIEGFNRRTEIKQVNFALDSGKKLLKVDTVLQKDILKDEIATEKAFNTLETGLEEKDEAADDLEGIIEPLEEKNQDLFESSDPPGLEAEEEMAEENEEDYEESADEALDEIVSEDQYTMEDADSESQDRLDIAQESSSEMIAHEQELVLDSEERSRENLEAQESKTEQPAWQLEKALKEGNEKIDVLEDAVEDTGIALDAFESDVKNDRESFKSDADEKMNAELVVAMNSVAKLNGDSSSQIVDGRKAVLDDLAKRLGRVQSAVSAVMFSAEEQGSTLIANTAAALTMNQDRVQKAGEDVTTTKRRIDAATKLTKAIAGMSVPLQETVEAVKQSGQTSIGFMKQTASETRATVSQMELGTKVLLAQNTKSNIEAISDTAKSISERQNALQKSTADKVDVLQQGNLDAAYKLKGDITKARDRMQSLLSKLKTMKHQIEHLKAWISKDSGQRINDLRTLDGELTKMLTDYVVPITEGLDTAVARATASVNSAQEYVGDVGKRYVASAHKSSDELKTKLDAATSLLNHATSEEQALSGGLKTRLDGIDEKLDGFKAADMEGFKEATSLIQDVSGRAAAAQAGTGHAFANVQATAKAEVGSTITKFDAAVDGEIKKMADEIGAARLSVAATATETKEALQSSAAAVAGQSRRDSAALATQMEGLEAETQKYGKVIEEGKESATAAVDDWANKGVNQLVVANGLIEDKVHKVHESMVTLRAGIGDQLAVGQNIDANLKRAQERAEFERHTIQADTDQGLAAVKSGLQVSEDETSLEAESLDHKLYGTAGQLKGEAKGLQQSGRAAMATIETEEEKVHKVVLDEQMKIKAGVALEARAGAEEVAEGASVESDLRREAAVVAKALTSSEQEVMKKLESLDTAGKYAWFKQTSAQIVKGQELLSKEVDAATDTMNTQAYGLGHQADGMIHDATHRLAGLENDIKALEADGMKQLGSQQDSESENVDEEQKTREALMDVLLEAHFAKQDEAERMKGNIKGLGDDLAEMQEMMKYAGAEALEKVHTATALALNETDGLMNIVTNVLQPKTTNFRRGVGHVFEGMGFNLDLDAVDDMADATMDEEASLRDKLNHARFGLQDEMRAAQQKTKRDLMKATAMSKMKIDEIKRMVHLTDEERMKRIAQIENDANVRKNNILKLANAQVGSMSHVGQNIEEKEMNINTMRAQAAVLSGGITTHPDLPKTLENQRLAIKADITGVYRDYVNAGPIQEDASYETFGASSLLEQGEAVPEHLQRQLLAPSAETTLKAARNFEDVREHFQRDAEESDAKDAGWESTLHHLVAG